MVFIQLPWKQPFIMLEKRGFRCVRAWVWPILIGSLKFDSSDPQEQSSDDAVNLFNFNITGVGMRVGGAFGGLQNLDLDIEVWLV